MGSSFADLFGQGSTDMGSYPADIQAMEGATPYYDAYDSQFGNPSFIQGDQQRTSAFFENATTEQKVNTLTQEAILYAEEAGLDPIDARALSELRGRTASQVKGKLIKFARDGGAGPLEAQRLANKAIQKLKDRSLKARGIEVRETQ